MRFGLATCDITPPNPMSMGGYFNRDLAFEAVHDALTLTVLVLDEAGRRMVIASADLVEFRWGQRTWSLMQRVAQVAHCPVDAVVLNASHTHGGPQIPAPSDAFRTLRDLPGAEKYCDWLAEQVVRTVKVATENWRDGSMEYSQGSTQFPVNRRGKKNGVVEMIPAMDGPIDERMQVLLLKDETGKPAAVGMRMACHPTTVGSQYQITSEYVGAWRDAVVEAMGKNVTPFFLQGCAGDSRPRASVNEARDEFRRVGLDELRALGKQLFGDTMQALNNGSTRKLGPLSLRAKIQVVTLECREVVTDEKSLERYATLDDAKWKYYVNAIRTRLAMGQAIPRSVQWHVQTIWLDEVLAMITLDAEPVGGLARCLERAVHPRDAMVLGYTNGCLGYLPDSAVLEAGGYEAESWLYEGWSGPFTQGAEHFLVPAVDF